MCILTYNCVLWLLDRDLENNFFFPILPPWEYEDKKAFFFFLSWHLAVKSEKAFPFERHFKFSVQIGFLQGSIGVKAHHAIKIPYGFSWHFDSWITRTKGNSGPKEVCSPLPKNLTFKGHQISSHFKKNSKVTKAPFSDEINYNSGGKDRRKKRCSQIT